MPPRTTPTDADLQAAWQLRRRHDWPATYADSMASPVHAGLVRATAIARLLADQHRDALRRFATPTSAAALPVANAPPPVAALPVLRQVLDLKRRASGERDDD